MAHRVAVMLINSNIDIEQELKAVQAYLPSNYHARIEQKIVIRGSDVAGWTMDEYVLPRLASGLHWGIEVDDRI